MARSPYILVARGKKNTWYIRYTDPSGQRVFRSTGTADRTLATEWASKLHAETYRTSRLGEKPERRWVEAVPRWLADKQAKRSLGKDLHNLRWLDAHLREKTLGEINSDLLAELLVLRMAEPRVKRAGRKDERTTSRCTAEKMLALVRSILRAAHSWGWLDHVPAMRLQENGKAKEDYRWLTVREAERLHDESVCAGDRLARAECVAPGMEPDRSAPQGGLGCWHPGQGEACDRLTAQRPGHGRAGHPEGQAPALGVSERRRRAVRPRQQPRLQGRPTARPHRATALARPAAHLGQLARHGRHVAAIAHGAGWLALVPIRLALRSPVAGTLGDRRSTSTDFGNWCKIGSNQLEGC